MSLSNSAYVVSFDVDAMVAAVRDVTEGTVRSIVEYDREEFNALYVDELTMALYESEDHMLDHFEEIHSYVHVDFTEMELFTEELFPIADRARYLTTAFDTFTLVRIYLGDEGLFIALDPAEPVEPVVETVERVHGSEG
jgi:hypothetical protein